MISWEGQMGLAKESSYGTPVDPTRFLDVQSGNVEAEATRVLSEEARGDRWQHRDEFTGLDYTLSWEQWGSPNHIGEEIYYALGAVSTATLSGSEKRHTITPNSSLPSFTLSVDRNVGANPTFRLAGSKINSLSFENTARDILRITVDGNGQKHDWVSALSPSDSDYPSVRPFQFKDLALSKGYDGVAPSADTTIERFMVSIVNNLVTDKVTADGTDYIAELPEGVLEITGAFDREFEGQEDFNKFVADADLDIVATWTSVSMGTNDYRLQLDLPKCKITSLPLPQIAGTSERGVYTVEFRGLYYVTDSRVMAAILDNIVASY